MSLGIIKSNVLNLFVTSKNNKTNYFQRSDPRKVSYIFWIIAEKWTQHFENFIRVLNLGTDVYFYHYFGRGGDGSGEQS